MFIKADSTMGPTTVFTTSLKDATCPTKDYPLSRTNSHGSLNSLNAMLAILPDTLDKIYADEDEDGLGPRMMDVITTGASPDEMFSDSLIDELSELDSCLSKKPTTPQIHETTTQHTKTPSQQQQQQQQQQQRAMQVTPPCTPPAQKKVVQSPPTTIFANIQQLEESLVASMHRTATSRSQLQHQAVAANSMPSYRTNIAPPMKTHFYTTSLSASMTGNPTNPAFGSQVTAAHLNQAYSAMMR